MGFGRRRRPCVTGAGCSGALQGVRFSPQGLCLALRSPGRFVFSLSTSCPEALHTSKCHFWALSICHFCSSLSVFLDLLPRKQTRERPLLVQDEDKLKKQEMPTETAFPRQASEATLPKISIPIPEEQKALKSCQLYSSLLPSPRVPFVMSFLLVVALTVWWLLFL